MFKVKAELRFDPFAEVWLYVNAGPIETKILLFGTTDNEFAKRVVEAINVGREE